LREHFAELRRALVAGIDTQTDRITAEVRALLLEALPPPDPRAPLPEADTPPPPRAPATPLAWIVACTALAIALLSTALWWRSVRVLEGMQQQLSQLRAGAAAGSGKAAVTIPAPAAEPPAASPAAAPAAPAPPRPVIVTVPYGADALGGTRLETVRTLLYRLARQKVAGVVEIRTFAGRFCLVGNALDGYSPAPDETLVSKCDLVGNPSEESLTAAQRMPLAFANLIGDIRNASHGALDVQVSSGDPNNLITPYPVAVSDLTAGEWNRAGSANNRIEIRIR
ncbi:MAG: hypothetical protein JO173_11080, partial [Gammaproteobacteria bacterium]|nr:hypothetical protein [Gammaproteobacteria bacterium]